MDDEFAAAELLYRGILPDYISDDGKIQSAAFKCRGREAGVSVDRQGSRLPQKALDFAKQHLNKGFIATVIVQDVWDSKAIAIYDPSARNRFHTQLYRNIQGERLTNGQSRRLSRIAKLVYDSR